MSTQRCAFNRQVAADELDGAAVQFAIPLARSPQRAIRHTKRLVNDGPGNSIATQFDEETEALVGCVGDADFGEGVTAFIARRKA